MCRSLVEEKCYCFIYLIKDDVLVLEYVHVSVRAWYSLRPVAVQW